MDAYETALKINSELFGGDEYVNEEDVKKVQKILEQRQTAESGVNMVIIGEIKSHIKSMLIEAEDHAKAGNYLKAFSLKEQTTGCKRSIDVIRKHMSK